MDDTKSDSSEASIESVIVIKSFKRTKSKRVVTKNNRHTNRKCASMSIIENKTNPNKRKLNEYDTNINNNNKNNNNNNNNNNNTEPNRKRRKFNANNTSNKLNALIESNQLLKQQNNELIQERDHYKTHAIKWKSQYMKLYSTISEITDFETTDLATHNNKNVKKNVITSNKNHPNYAYIKMNGIKLGNTTNNKSQYLRNVKRNIKNTSMIETFHRNGNLSTKKATHAHSSKKNRKHNKIKHRNKSVSNGNIMHHKTKVMKSNTLNLDNTRATKTRNKAHTLIQRTDEMCKNNSSNNCNTYNTKYDSIRDRLVEMGFDRTKVVNKLSVYNNSHKKPEFVFNEVINTFTPDTSGRNGIRQLRSDTKKKTKKRKRPNFNNNKRYNDSSASSDSVTESNIDDDDDDDNISVSDIETNNATYVEFENSYYISVHCHMCQKHFDDIYEYRDHLQEHYNTDSTKTWLQCDWGCNIKPLDSWKFIRHISTHTKDAPYKCNVTVNGVQCTASHGYTRYLKDHWRSHFDIYIQSTDGENQSESESVHDDNQMENKFVHNNKSLDMHSNKYEDCYYVSVHCHICKKHFDDFTLYKDHLEKHYHDDPNRTWRFCDFGCKINGSKPFHNNVRFIGHLATHTKDKPFTCGILINGIKCNTSFGMKTDFKQHWKRHFKKEKEKENENQNQNQNENQNENTNENENQNENTNENENSIAIRSVKRPSTEMNSAENIEFENSYYVSVDCHLCGKHFSLFNEYRNHIRKHYQTDPLRQWLQCDFGCTVDAHRRLFSGSSGFISHISTHTKDYPFKCNLIIDGNSKCKNGSGIKSDLKRHWLSCHKNKNTKTNTNTNTNPKDMSASTSSASSSASASESEYENINESTSSVTTCFESDSISSINSDESDNNCYGFEQNYFVSVGCHLCKKHFDNIVKYRDHLKKHYVNDANRVWKQCDFNCVTNRGKPVTSINPSNFIAHIAHHTQDRPFKCNVITNGVKCVNDAGAKGTLRNHWKSVHYKQYKLYNKNKNNKNNNIVKLKERKRYKKKCKKNKQT